MNSYHISQLAKRYVEYDMIQAHTELPAFPNARAELMFAFLNRSKPTAEHSELLALVTSLVQVGLDTHDTIGLAAERHNDRNLRSRQLKVLAGDYFSSRFYNLLAKQGQIDAIRRLSQAVCDINRLKMTIVDKMKQWSMTAEEYLRTGVILKKILFQSFNDQMNREDALSWEELLDSITELEVLKREQERARQFERFEGSWSYWHVWQQGTDEERKRLKLRLYDMKCWHLLMSKYEVRERLSYQIRLSCDNLHMLVASLPLDGNTRRPLEWFLAPAR